VVIPTRDGLVVAADSRSTVLGQYYDGVAKLKIAATDTPMLVTITGNSDFADPPPAGVTLRDWMPRATYRYQGSAFVLSYLAKRSAFVLSEASLVETADKLAESLSEFLKSKPLVAAPSLRVRTLQARTLSGIVARAEPDLWLCSATGWKG